MLSIALACLSLPPYQLIYGPNIDDSLHWAYNYFAYGRFGLVQQVTFPHGPLAFILYPLALEKNFIIALGVQLILAAALARLIFQLRLVRDHVNLLFTSAAALVVLSVSDIQLLLAGLVAGLVMLDRLQPKNIHGTLISLFTAFAVFIKTYAAVICGLIVAADLVYRIQRGRNLTALAIAGQCTLFFVAGWLMVFGNFEYLISFITAQLQLSLDNSEAVQFSDPEISWWLVGSALLVLPLLYTAADEPYGKQYFTLMALPLFAAWKHGMARADVVHVTGFVQFLVVFLLMFLLISPQRSLRVIFLCALIPGLLLIQLTRYERIGEYAERSFIRAGNLWNTLGNYDSLVTSKGSEIAFAIRNQKLPDTLKSLIGTSSVDVYPWNYSLAGANELNWRPRPVLNSYAAYTQWLDERDALHFASAGAPEFILWEFTDPNERGMDLESIDNRYLLNDEPSALSAVISRYEPVYHSSRFVLLRKRSQPFKCKSTRLSSAHSLPFGEWLDVPRIDGGILRARVNIKKNLPGALKSLVYKGQIFHIFYELSDGRVLSHRIVPKNAARGVWIAPLILVPSLHSPVTVERIMIRCDDPSKTSGTVSVSFEKTEWRLSDKTVDACRLFSLRCGDTSSLVYRNLSRADISSEPGHFSDAGVTSDPGDFLSPPASYRVGRHQHAGVFNIPLYGLPIDSALQYRFHFEASVISRGSASFMLFGDSVIYNKELTEIVRGSDDWTYCSSYFDVAGNDLQRYERIYFSVVNTGGEALFADDIAVSLYRIAN